MLTILIGICSFICVAALVAAVGSMFRSKDDNAMDTRLDALTRGGGGDDSASSQSLLLSQPLDDRPGIAELVFSRIGDVKRFIAQSGMSITPTHFLMMTVGAALAGMALSFVFNPLHAGLTPIVGLACALLPFFVVWFKRRRRMAAFARQLPQTLELLSRALRAGHSLAAGFSLIGEEMMEPIANEFARCYEEQNLGIPLDEALEDMTERVPNLDLRFFATAVILQRQTGGDLAEILDKIGDLVRERFKIWGQIQALTGEGRLSGSVLLALPPVLFLALYRLNPTYCMILFEDPIGQQMLAAAVVMQILGAIVIKKIISIKV